MSVSQYKLGSVFSAGSQSQWQTRIGGNSGVDVNPLVPLPLEDSGTLTQSARFDNASTFYAHTLSMEQVTRTNRGVIGTGLATEFTSTSDTTVVLPSITPNDDSLFVVVFYHSNGSAITLANITISDSQGLTWTEVSALQSGTGDGYVGAVKVWSAPVVSAAATVVTITHPTVSDANLRSMRTAQAFDFQNYDTSDPIGATASAVNVGSGAVNLTLSAAPAATSEVVAICANAPNGGGSLTATPAAGWTEIYDTATAGYGHLQTQVRIGSTSDQVDWTDVAVGDTVYSNDSIALAFEVKYPSLGAQNLTQSARFDNSNTFYAHTLTPGAVTLTQSSRFDNAQTFYTHTLSTTRTLTQSARFDNTNTFYTHTLTTTRALTQSARFDNANSFYTHVLTPGAVALTQSARFDDADTFYAHTLTPGAVALTQSARFDNANTFYTHVLSQVGGAQNLTQTARFDNAATFYTHTLTPGAVALTQSARFDNAQTFYTHALSTTYALTQASRFDDADGFYTHVLTPTYALTQSARFDNDPTFYTHTLSSTVALSQSARFDNSNTFYTHTLSQEGGALNLTQTARFDNANDFYAHTLTTGAVALTQASRFDNDPTFYTHTLTPTYALTQTARFDNTNNFYAHTLSVGAVTLTQTARLDNANTFYAHALDQEGALVQTARFDNANTFYAHTLTVTQLGGHSGVVRLAGSLSLDEMGDMLMLVRRLSGSAEIERQQAETVEAAAKAERLKADALRTEAAISAAIARAKVKRSAIAAQRQQDDDEEAMALLLIA
jgi:hypothetical protein